MNFVKKKQSVSNNLFKINITTVNKTESVLFESKPIISWYKRTTFTLIRTPKFCYYISTVYSHDIR